MRDFRMRLTRLLVVAASAAALASSARRVAAQNAPFVVHDAKPVIIRGPFLIDPSETAVTIVWTTDAPSHSEVRYGTGTVLDKKAESVRHGLVDIGTLHSIRVTGLTPGRTYNYQIASTRVVKMKAYWPEKGTRSGESGAHIHHAGSFARDGAFHEHHRHTRKRGAHRFTHARD